MRDAGSLADLAKIKEKAEAGAREEMEKMMRAKDASVEERERVRRAMEEQSIELELQLEEARRDRSKRDATEARLREMESKLIHGVDDLEKRNLELLEEARAVEDLLEERAVGNEQARRKIETLELNAKQRREDFTEKQNAVAEITRLLRGSFHKYQSAKADLETHARLLRREKEDMVDSINLLRRQLALKETLIDAFVPRETVAKVTAFAVWEDDAERWVLEKISNRHESSETASLESSGDVYAETENVSAVRDKDADGELRAARLAARRRERRGLRPTCDADELRPTCDRARVAVAMGDTNPRYVSENILRLDLDFPERTTFDLFGEEAATLFAENGERVDPRSAARDAASGVQAVLDIAFAGDRGARLAPYSNAKGAERAYRAAEKPTAGDAAAYARRAPAQPASAKRR
jgi:kinesin family protein 3/17